MQKTALIFDLDGTLLDTLTDLANSLNAALETLGLPQRTISEVRQFVGNGINKLVERAIENGTENPLYPEAVRLTRENYARKNRENTAPYPGIPELLRALSEKGIRLGVVSNKPDAQVRSLCADFFGEYITVAIGQQEGVRMKPAPDSLLRAMELLHCDASNTVYAGDSDVDIDTANNAGIPCISVLWGFRDKAQLLAAGAQHFAEAPAEILTIL